MKFSPIWPSFANAWPSTGRLIPQFSNASASGAKWHVWNSPNWGRSKLPTSLFARRVSDAIHFRLVSRVALGSSRRGRGQSHAVAATAVGWTGPNVRSGCFCGGGGSLADSGRTPIEHSLRTGEAVSRLDPSCASKFSCIVAFDRSRSRNLFHTPHRRLRLSLSRACRTSWLRHDHLR